MIVLGAGFPLQNFFKPVLLNCLCTGWVVLGEIVTPVRTSIGKVLVPPGIA